MSTVRDLLSNNNLAKLIACQHALDRAGEMFDDVWQEEGAPSEAHEILDGFFQAKSECEKHIERLMGSVVYHGLFFPEYFDSPVDSTSEMK